MRKIADPKKNQAAGLSCRTPWKVTKVQAMQNYRLQVEFADGTQGLVDMQRFLSRECGVFKALRESSVFMQAYIDHGAVTWPGELDLAPDRMHEELQNTDVYTVQ